MKKLKYLIPFLLILLLLTVPAWAEEAENLTDSLAVKTVDKTGKAYAITDGKYTTFWESSSRKNPWVVISSDKPIYGLYLCFQKMPDTYVIQKQSGDDWVTVAEGGEPRYHHAFFALDGLQKIRILSTMDKKNVMGFNEIFAFGEGSVPEWVQRWEEPVEKADLLILVAHPDDELLFTGGAIPTYDTERGKQVAVAYLTYSNTTRRSEALNGLWAMGVRHYPVFGAFSDRYAKSGKAKDAYKEAGGKQKVLDWVTELYRRFRPEVVVTHGEDGEYGHPQHKMVADAAKECFALAADAEQSSESAQIYGAWQVKKLYLHQYGDEAEQTVLDWDQPLSAFGGKTGAELAAEAFALHESQKGMGTKIKGTFVEFTVEETGARTYPYDHFGLQSSTVGPDKAKNDFLEHIAGEGEMTDTAVNENSGDTEPEPAEEKPTDEEAKEEEEPAEGEPAGEEPAEESVTGEEPGTEEKTAEEAGDEYAADPSAPEWADVSLNARGYLDAGEYVLEDEENGHWMFVNRTFRVQIERKAEELEVIKKENNVKKKVKTKLVTYTAHIWCDIGNGESPRAVYNNPDPESRHKSKYHEFVAKIAEANQVVFATSADYYTYRISMKYPTGIEVRNGEVIFDDPHKLEYDNMPTYETLALYSDGRAESFSNPEKSAGEYVAEGATQVYTFGPCLVKDGKLTDYIEHAFLSTDIRYALGMVKPGHYVAIMSEGRIKRSQGIQMATLAQRMLDEGCQVAVNLDGGQSAVFAFMGKQLNTGAKDLPKGRKQAEIIAFGTSEKVGTDSK